VKGGKFPESDTKRKNAVQTISCLRTARQNHLEEVGLTGLPGQRGGRPLGPVVFRFFNLRLREYSYAAARLRRMTPVEGRLHFFCK